MREHQNFKQETTIEFNANVVGWGFPYFVPLSNIGDPKENYLVDDTLLIEAEITVSNVMHPSVSVETKEPEQQSIQAPPPPPVIAKEKELPKDPSVESKESSQDVLTKSKSLLTELSSRTTTQRSSSTDDISVSPQPDNLQQENEALAGFFNMSLEAIQQANVFGNIEEIIRTLIPNTNDLQKKTVLEDLASRLKEFQEIIPTAKATVEAAENRRKSLLEKTTKLDSKLAESREKLRSLDSELSKISNEVKKIETEIQWLTAQKEKLLVEKKNVVAQVEKANPEALKDLEEWKKLEEEMKQANAEWVGAKEKSALANENEAKLMLSGLEQKETISIRTKFVGETSQREELGVFENA
ncbi:MATH domain and coiled-coil domain-containing protein At3g58410-like [Jatropha curcas]|uniref:MATH domain and coiled-coil domain-containing protein At3g58410-like n=1 Tax=Jatropha curcas TaxID=180498 RepID=UPI001893A210|nr:MATH domain and coiled-coil domain-containing protein At3g58410-like [Jatropha curcas]